MKQFLGSVIYLSHGGGPMPLLGEKSHIKMVEFMASMPKLIEKPDEVLIISAHWEESLPTVLDSNPEIDLLYDYYGFPRESYEIEYRPKGNPGLVKDIKSLLDSDSIGYDLNLERGLDHGVFVPLKLIYPDADIPVTQISLLKSLDPKEHLDLGRALRPLLDRNILVIGSGFSFHNMEQYSFDGRNNKNPKNDQFQDWLIKSCVRSESYEKTEKQLVGWKDAPYARYCHPREEHLLPLLFCAGMAGTPADLIFDDYIAGMRSIAFMW